MPERFVPPDALASPEQAVGRAPAAAIPAGSYLLAAQLASRPGTPDAAAGQALGPARRPVEISVTGAEALAATAAIRRARGSTWS